MSVYVCECVTIHKIWIFTNRAQLLQSPNTNTTQCSVFGDGEMFIRTLRTHCNKHNAIWGKSKLNNETTICMWNCTVFEICELKRDDKRNQISQRMKIEMIQMLDSIWQIFFFKDHVKFQPISNAFEWFLMHTRVLHIYRQWTKRTTIAKHICHGISYKTDDVFLLAWSLTHLSNLACDFP